MSKNKAVSTLVHLINWGISASRYYGSSADKSVQGLEGSKAYWDDQHRLCFVLKGKTYRLIVESVDSVT